MHLRSVTAVHRQESQVVQALRWVHLRPVGNRYYIRLSVMSRELLQSQPTAYSFYDFVYITAQGLYLFIIPVNKLICESEGCRLLGGYGVWFL
jgi:hypothetical protein